MSFKCCVSKCESFFNITETYRVHLKVIHLISKDKKVKCTVDKCSVEFSNVNKLTRHLTTIHKIQDKVDRKVDSHQLIREKENTKELFHQTSKDAEETQNECCDNVDSYKNNESSDNSTAITDQFDKIFFEFLRKLHGNSFLTKTVIHDIYNSIKTEIIDQIQPLLNTEKKLIETISNSHKKFDSIYKFEKHLTEKGLIIKGSYYNFLLNNFFSNLN